MLAVEVEDGREPAGGLLAGRGLTVVADGHLLLVACATRARTTWCGTRSCDLDLALVRIEPRRHRLEDLFRDSADAA